MLNEITVKIKDFIDHWFGYFPPHDKAFPKPLNEIILPIIRRVMPSIIAHDIIGVSPMTGPVESIFALRVKYAESQKDNEDESES